MADQTPALEPKPTADQTPATATAPEPKPTTPARMGPWEGVVHLAAVLGCLALGILALRATPPATTLAEYALAGMVVLAGIRVADVLSLRSTGAASRVGPLAVLTFAALALASA